MERDKEIERIIERLEAENTSSSSDVSKKYQAEIERLKISFQLDKKQVGILLDCRRAYLTWIGTDE